MFPPPQITSAGLDIREFHPQDLARVTALVAAGDRTALPPGAPVSAADVRAWLAGTVQQRLDGTGLHLVIVAAADGEIVGSAGLRNTDWAAGHSEIGYGISAAHRRRGHATVAAREIGRWALREGGMRRIQLHARVDNIASVRAAERAGYQREGTLRLADWDGDKAHDLAVFSMIAADLETSASS